MVVTGLAASVSPVAVAAMISMLSMKGARRNTFFFLAGFVLTLLCLGAAGLFLFQLGGAGRTGGLHGVIDLVLGGFCLLAIPWEPTRKTGDAAPARKGALSAPKAFLFGCLSMSVNASTFVIFTSGLHDIASSDKGGGGDLLALGVLIIFTLITLLVPVAIYCLFPGGSEKVLSSTKAWLGRHRRKIAALVLSAFGAYLLLKGIVALV